MPAYRLYGIRFKSPWPLPGLETDNLGPADCEIVEGPASLFTAVARQASNLPQVHAWYHYTRLPDGEDYLCFPEVFESLISADGRRIACRPHTATSLETFHSYLLAHVLSFSLLKQGIEHIHCTAVVVDGGVVGFLGDCGYGKSSLGAAFLKAGYPLLTDDLIVLKEEGQGFVAFPGPPKIKLFPEIARAILGEGVIGIPMNRYTPKLIIPLRPEQFFPKALPLRALFVLRPGTGRSPSKKITIRTLNERGAFLPLIENTFNPVITEPDRLKRQFALADRLTAVIPIKSLSYPRDLAILPEVVKAIRSTLSKM